MGPWNVRITVCRTRNRVVAPSVQPLRKQGVVLLLNADAGDAAKNIEMVGQFLKLNQLDLPGPMLLLDDGLQRNRGVAMPASGIVENDMDLLFRGHPADFAIVIGRLLHTNGQGVTGAFTMPCG